MYDWLSKGPISRRSWHHPQHQRSHELSQAPWSSCSCTQVWQRSTGHCQCLWILQQWTQNFWQDPKRPTDKQQECSPRVPSVENEPARPQQDKLQNNMWSDHVTWEYKVFPEFAKLASIGLCMPITSVPAECGYSLLSSEANSHDHFPLAHTANISNGMRQHWKKILHQESFWSTTDLLIQSYCGKIKYDILQQTSSAFVLLTRCPFFFNHTFKSKNLCSPSEMTVHSPLLNGSQTSQSARGYTRTKLLPRSWEQYQCVQYFRVSKQWYGCQCLGGLMHAQILMHSTWGMYRHCKEVCTERWLWEINPLLHQGLKPSSMLHLGFWIRWSTNGAILITVNMIK